MKKTITLLLSLLSYHSSFAFDLKEAWQAARVHSAQYQAAGHELNASYESEIQAKSQLFPQVNASASYNDQPQSGYDKYQNHGWNVELNQPLFDKSKWSQYQAEKITTDIANSSFNNTDAELLLQVSQAYLSILTIQDKLTAVDAEKTAYTLQITQAEALFEAGQATIIDSYEAQSGYDAAVAKETDLTTQLNTAQNTLLNLTSLDPNQLESLSIQQLPDWLSEYSEDMWLIKAFENNPELDLRHQQLAKSQADLTTTKDERLPSVNLNMKYQDIRYDTRSDSGENHHSRGRGAYIGLQVSVPIYTGGYTSSKIRQGEEIAYQQQSLLEASQRDTELKVKQAYATLRGKQAQITAQQRLLETNNAKLKAIQQGRDYGVRNNMDEIKARQDKASAEEQLAEAKYQYIETYLQLLYVTGDLNTGKGEEVVLLLFGQ